MLIREIHDLTDITAPRVCWETLVAKLTLPLSRQVWNPKNPQGVYGEDWCVRCGSEIALVKEPYGTSFELSRSENATSRMKNVFHSSLRRGDTTCSYCAARAAFALETIQNACNRHSCLCETFLHRSKLRHHQNSSLVTLTTLGSFRVSDLHWDAVIL